MTNNKELSRVANRVVLVHAIVGLPSAIGAIWLMSVASQYYDQAWFSLAQSLPIYALGFAGGWCMKTVMQAMKRTKLE